MANQAQPTSNRTRQKQLAITTISVVLLVVVYFGFYRLTGLAIPCWFYEITGWYCPGCGISRMLLSICAGDFYQAFRYNPLLFILLPFAIVLFVNWIYAEYSGKKSWYKEIPEWVWIALAIVLTVYGVLRNLPAFGFLAPTLVG